MLLTQQVYWTVEHKTFLTEFFIQEKICGFHRLEQRKQEALNVSKDEDNFVQRFAGPTALKSKQI